MNGRKRKEKKKKKKIIKLFWKEGGGGEKQGYLRSTLSRRQLQGFVRPRPADASFFEAS